MAAGLMMHSPTEVGRRLGHSQVHEYNEQMGAIRKLFEAIGLSARY